MKPYSQAESERDPRKRLFNRRQSGIRTVMTECIFGRLIRRFPILKDLRTHLKQSHKTILAAVILQNIATEWQEEDVPGEDEVDNEHGDGGREIVGPHRLQGNMVRDQMLRQMPP